MRGTRTIAVGLVCLASGVPWLAQELEKKLLPMNGVSNEEFGSSVSVSGDLVLIGARLNDDQDLNAGAAYVFAREGGAWLQQSKLLPTDGTFDQQFGFSVAVDDRIAVVGAWHDGENGLYSGSAYVFAKTDDDWFQQAKLLAGDGDFLDEFGRRVAVSGHTIAIAAGFDDDNGANSGSVYIFVRRGKRWVEQAKLLPADGQPSDVFGSDVDMDGDTVLIGAALDDDQGTDSGSAYVFVRSGSTWVQQTKILPGDGNQRARFGSSVSLAGDMALIGAPEDDDNGIQSGSAYVFLRRHGVWTQQTKLLPSDGGRGDTFGTSVGLSNNAAVIGAPLDSDRAISAGSAYLFVYSASEWKERGKILASDGGNSDNFGASVAVDYGTLVSSSPNNSQNGSNAGAAYVSRTGSGNCLGESPRVLSRGATPAAGG